MVGIGVGAAQAQPGSSPATTVAEPPVTTVAERAAFYAQVADLDSVAELTDLAHEGDASRWQVEAIVERVFELDPTVAVQLASELRPDLVAQLYGRLVVIDVNAALAALSQLDNPAEASIAAMATFRGLGRDERAFELVAASLTPVAAERFRADAISQLAIVAPRRAFVEALALTDPQARKMATTVVIDSWAREAPADALAAVDAMRDPELARMLRAAVLRSWQDPDTLASYLATLEVAERRLALGVAFSRVTQADPERAAQLVMDFPPDERRPLLWQVGTSYAQRDPDAAFAWARSVGEQEPDLVIGVLRGVAARDPLRAFGLAESLDEPARDQGYLAAVSVQIADERQFTALASRVAALPEGQTKTALLTSMIGSWAMRPGNAEPVLQWMLAQGAALPPESFERIGYLYAQSNPDAAAAYLDRVPQSARPAWLSAVTAAYGNRDPAAAAAFLDRYRGDPAFDRAAITLSQQLAVTDPPRAAQLLATVGPRGLPGAGPELMIARSWAQRDPEAATAWAIELPMPMRTIATLITTSAWATRDPAAVGDWALRQPPGEKRDAALQAAVRARGAAPPDTRLLNAFSDDRARQSAMMSTIMATAPTDAAAARRLIDDHITDPRLQVQARQMVDGIERGAVPMPAGGVGFPTGARPGAPGMPSIPGFVVAPTDPTMMVRPPEPGLVPLPPGMIPPVLQQQSQGPPLSPPPRAQ